MEQDCDGRWFEIVGLSTAIIGTFIMDEYHNPKMMHEHILIQFRMVN
jgi:hypothetical protein